MTSPAHTPADHRKGLMLIHLATLMAGITGLFGKWVTAGPAVITGGRTLVAFVALVALARFRGVSLRMDGRRTRIMTLASGVLLAAHWWTFFHAIAISSVAIGLIGFAGYPLFVTLLEPLFFREKYRPLDFVAAAVVASGLALVAGDNGAGGSVAAGLGWGVASGGLCAGVSLLGRATVGGHPTVRIATWQQGAAMVVSLPFAIAAHDAYTPLSLALVALMGLVFTAGLQMVFVESLRHIRVRTASIVLMLEPVYAIAFAWLIFHETPTARMACGGALVLGAALAVTLLHAPAKGSER